MAQNDYFINFPKFFLSPQLKVQVVISITITEKAYGQNRVVTVETHISAYKEKSFWQVVLDLSSSHRNAIYKLGFYRLSVILSEHLFSEAFKLELLRLSSIIIIKLIH